MKLESPAEAFSALAVLVLGADRVGTFEERRFLFETMAGHPVFEGLDRDAFADLVHGTTDRVCDAFPTDGTRVTDEGVSRATTLIADALTSEQRLEAFRLAVGLARADGITGAERSVLERVRAGLGVDPGVAGQLLEG